MKATKRYYKDIKTIFPFHAKREKVFLNNLLIQIIEYSEENNKCTYTDLQNEFGTPIEILKSYYDSIDSEYLLNKMNNKLIIHTFAIVIILLLSIISLSYIFFGTII